MERTDFSLLCRKLRAEKGLTQRGVAWGMKVAPSTYSNLESRPHRVVAPDKLEALIRFYALDEAAAAEMRALYEALPLSSFATARREYWARRNKMRSKSLHHDRLFLSLVEVLGVLIPATPDPVCSCEFGAPACEVCSALNNLGLNGWTTREEVLANLAKLTDKLERASKAESEEGATE